MPIYSRARFLPPSVFHGCQIKNSIIADGCSIERGATIENSIIGVRSKIGPEAAIRNSVVMGADELPSPEQLRADDVAGHPHLGVGAGAVIDGAIIDKNCHVGDNVHIAPGQLTEAEINSWCQIREGIAVLCKGAIVPSGWSVNS